MGSVSTAPRRRVLVVDDHPIVREGIGQLLAGQPDLALCGEATDVSSGRRAALELVPDVAVIDLSLGRQSGLELIEALARELPGLPMLALSMHDESLYARRALQAGARGYIMKQEGTALLLQALRTVLLGEVYVSAAVNASLLRSLAPGRITASGMGELTNRELEVYRLVGAGVGTRDIARQLHLSSKTIETHRANIKQKLGLSTAAELVVHAARALADPES